MVDPLAVFMGVIFVSVLLLDVWLILGIHARIVGFPHRVENTICFAFEDVQGACIDKCLEMGDYIFVDFNMTNNKCGCKSIEDKTIVYINVI